MALTPEAKALFATTVRGLRERLVRDLSDAVRATYRLQLPLASSGLSGAAAARRERLEEWLDERVRAQRPGTAREKPSARDRQERREGFLLAAVKEAAATLLHRLVVVKQLEALGISRPAVVTGGWNSKGYAELRSFAPALTADSTDPTEGYAFLLKLVWGELALDLTGLFGDVGLTDLVPVPAATLREVVERLDDEGLAGAFTDDTVLGWAYHYWNDPDREALDAKLHGGGKVEPHEIATPGRDVPRGGAPPG